MQYSIVQYSVVKNLHFENPPKLCSYTKIGKRPDQYSTCIRYTNMTVDDRNKNADYEEHITKKNWQGL